MKRTAFIVDVRFGGGVRSVLLGLAALALLVGSVAVLRASTGGEAGTLRLLLALGVLFVVVPVLLVKGLAAGSRAFGGGTEKGAAVAGIVLNFVLLVVVIALALVAWFAPHFRY